MARITVEDCLSKIDSQYDLVLLAKERTAQLNSGDKSLVPINRDKNTVISLREIGEGKISIKTIEDSAINKLRKPQSEQADLEDLETEVEDSFDKIYKGEVSKSGAAILPSKRARRMPEYVSSDSKTINKKTEEDKKQIEIKAEKEIKSAMEEESAKEEDKTK